MHKVLLKFILILVLFGYSFSSVSIKLMEKIKLASQNIILEKPGDISITNNNLILIADFSAGNIKVYNPKGKLIEVLGRKGYGPGEFVSPRTCSYNKNQFSVIDFGHRRIFVYQHLGKTKFIRTNKILCTALGYDTHIREDKLFVAGYINDNENGYELYSINLKNPKQKEYYLLSQDKYGDSSYQAYKNNYRRIHSRLGLNAFFDIHNNFIYFIWEAKMRIVKIDLSSKKFSTFGLKTPHYIQPQLTAKLDKLYKERRWKDFIKEKLKVSYIKNIFVNNNYCMIIYGGPYKEGSESNFRIQFYTHNGTFITEQPIPNLILYESITCIDKNQDFIYVLVSHLDDQKKDDFYLLKYQVMSIEK